MVTITVVRNSRSGRDDAGVVTKTSCNYCCFTVASNFTSSSNVTDINIIVFSYDTLLVRPLLVLLPLKPVLLVTVPLQTY